MNLRDIASGTVVYAIATAKADIDLTKEVQQRLVAYGYDLGSVDGDWGNRTQTAFAAFAQRFQLSATEISPKTASRLLQPVSQPTPDPKPTIPVVTTPSKPTPTPAPTPTPTPAPTPTPTPAPTPTPTPTPAPAPKPTTPVVTTPKPPTAPANLRAIASGKVTWAMAQIQKDLNLVKSLQQGLDIMGHEPGPVDGLWGGKTQTAYADFSKQYGLKAAEMSPQAALLLLEPAIPGIPVVRPIKTLVDADYQAVAKSIGCSVAAVRAVAEVEAQGSGFQKDGRPKILFEAHWFSEYTQGRFDRRYGDISSPVWNRDLYIGGAGEWDRLYKAACLDREAALMSASWGLGQVMGFNHKAAGYTTVEAFVKDMHQSEGKQLAAMFGYIKSNNLAQYLIKLDWAGFAFNYNGESYRVNQYDLKLADAYDYWANLA